jgi:hypothetical protein
MQPKCAGVLGIIVVTRSYRTDTQIGPTTLRNLMEIESAIYLAHNWGVFRHGWSWPGETGVAEGKGEPLASGLGASEAGAERKSIAREHA